MMLQENTLKSSRDLRQEEVVKNIITNKFRTWYSAFPGFGKTRICGMICDYALTVRSTVSFAVVVPTNVLEEHWTRFFKEKNISNYKIYVINGVTLKDIEITENITFLDEAHMYIEGKVFSKIFDLIKSKAIIPFSGTFKPEHKEFLNSIMPMADDVTYQEGIKNGWISDFKEYNLFVTLSPERQVAYNKIHELCEEYFAFFNQDFHTAKGCLSQLGARRFMMMNNIRLSHPMDNRPLTEKETILYISKKANIWRDSMQKRSEFINLSLEKIEATAYLVNSLKRKTVTFGLRNETADKLTDLIPNSESYHSKITGKIINGKKLGAKKVKELTLHNLENDIISCVNSSKALDLGLDIKGMDCSIIYCRNSTKEKNSQRIARTTRKEGDKMTIVINVILKNTKDEQWTKNAQYGRKNIININSCDELINHFKQFER